MPEFRSSASPVGFDEQVERVKSALEKCPRQERRRLGNARPLLYCHLVENCGFSVSYVAGCLEVTPSAVSVGIKRLKNKIYKDKKISGLLEEMSNVKI